jgi:dihydrofolate reductase
VRKVVVAPFLSLDGVAEQPREFITSWDEDVDAYGSRLIATQDTVLLGRRTYDEWVGFWPTSEIEPFASFINTVPKFVATSTTLSPTWANSTVIDTDLAAFVMELKQQPGGDIGVHGSISLTRSLLDMGLIDELRLCVAPVLQIKGHKLFDAKTARQLTLTGHAATPSGYLLLDYQVSNGAGGAATSS